MMIGLVFAVLTAAVIVFVTHPLLRPVTAQASADAPNADVETLKRQLSELEREAGHGLVDAADAEAMRLELSRRLLKAAQDGGARSASSFSAATAQKLFVAFAGFIALLGVLLYLRLGSPALPDRPLDARLDVPLTEQTPTPVVIANMERHLRNDPKDARGWALIAPIYMRLGDFDKSIKAYRHLLILDGESETTLLGLAEAYVFANKGEIPEIAQTAVAAALKLNPQSLRGRMWQALTFEQAGRPAEAIAIYRKLLTENIPEIWRTTAQARLADLEGKDPGGKAAPKPAQPKPAQPKPAQPTPAQTNEATAAPAFDRASPQGQMIQGMVDKLAARLQDNGDDLPGWLRLIKSYMVLQDVAKAQDALGQAKRRFVSDAQAISQLDALAKELSLPLPSPPQQDVKPQ